MCTSKFRIKVIKRRISGSVKFQRNCKQSSFSLLPLHSVARMKNNAYETTEGEKSFLAEKSRLQPPSVFLCVSLSVSVLLLLCSLCFFVKFSFRVCFHFIHYLLAISYNVKSSTTTTMPLPLLLPPLLFLVSLF